MTAAAFRRTLLGYEAIDVLFQRYWGGRVSDQSLSNETGKFLNDYVRHWYAGDWIAVAALYHVPCITMRGDGSVHCFQSSKELQEFFQGVGAGYDKEGNLGPGRYHSLMTQPIGARSLLATLTWQMVQKDGSIIREWRQSYNFVRIDGRLQILAATLHLE